MKFYIIINSFIFLSSFVQIHSFDIKKYPYHPKIHTLGNIGIGGKIHAKIAPYVTKLIDYSAYNKRNIRKEIYENIIENYDNHPYILDLCCGVGMSTPKHEKCIGIDTSQEMINEAKYIHKNMENNFLIGNAEDVYDTIDFNSHFINNNLYDFNGFDITTIFFGFHEIPQEARQKIISYHLQHTKEKLIVVDIDPNYKPSKMMYSGEPYLFDYKENIRKDLKSAKESIIVQNHVIIWTFDCK